MKRALSISYAPTPASRICGNVHTSRAPRAAWTLCRRFESYPVRDNAMLEHWTEQGRVRPDDFLVSLESELCVQARDVVELDAIFQKTRARLLGKVWPALACAAFVLAWTQPLFGAIVFISAVATAIMCHRPGDHPQTYSLYTDGHLREPRRADCDLASPA